MPGYVFKIQLVGTAVWRRVVLPQDITFHQLHRVIQLCMGWEERHLYSIKPQSSQLLFLETKEECEEYTQMQESRVAYMWQQGRPLVSTDLNEYRVARTTKIDKYLKDIKTFLYRYDMGDEWEHEITFEQAMESYNEVYPMIIEGEGDCPPEDCGGVSGYEYLCEVLKDPKHDEYEAISEWLGDYFKYRTFDRARRNNLISNVLKLKRPKKK